MWDDFVKGKSPFKDRLAAAWDLWWNVKAPIRAKWGAVWALMDTARHPWIVHITENAEDNVQKCRRCGATLMEPGVLTVMNAEPETAVMMQTSDGFRWMWKGGIRVAEQGPLLFALPESRIKGVYFADEIPCQKI